MKIFLVAGARPNYVKIAPLMRAFRKYKKNHPHSKIIYRLINTGQHYDYLMSKKIFKDLDIPTPYVDLGVGSASHGIQTAKIMMCFEKLLFRDRPDLIIVVGDVNSTMACALVGVKVGIPVAHVEAGLRSRDRTMPEEINRLVTDSISDYLFTTSKDANANLIREGISRKKIFFTGNVMVDSLLANLKRAKKASIRKKLGIQWPYVVLTLHRPSNVDKDHDFMEILRALDKIQEKTRILFPVHPRTAQRLNSGKIGAAVRSMKNLILIPPIGYLDFINLVLGSTFVLTDSGGVQEETSVLGIPCLTLRDNTERPVTLISGSNQLAGRRSSRIIRLAYQIIKSKKKKRKNRKPKLWDGRAANRIVAALAKEFKF